MTVDLAHRGSGSATKAMRGIYFVSKTRVAGRISDDLPRLIGRPPIAFCAIRARLRGRVCAISA